MTGARPGELEVIVACNGCTDRTADIARGFGEPVRVLETDQASKTAALNAADEVATGFPRFYVDADVVLDLASIRAMAAVLERGDALLAAPSLRMDLSKTTWPVRAYYRVWTSLPYNQVMVGTGAYGLSRAGRARFDRFPDVIADDGFVRFQFRPGERRTVQEADVLGRSAANARWPDPDQDTLAARWVSASPALSRSRLPRPRVTAEPVVLVAPPPGPLALLAGVSAGCELDSLACPEAAAWRSRIPLGEGRVAHAAACGVRRYTCRVGLYCRRTSTGAEWPILNLPLSYHLRR